MGIRRALQGIRVRCLVCMELERGALVYKQHPGLVSGPLILSWSIG